MFKRFLSLEWKQFSRSSYFQKGLAIKILLILAALYFIVCFGVLGVFSFFLIEDGFPNEDPLEVVNNYLVFWFLIDLGFRFFMQQLPVMNIKPYMIIPIKRETVIHYLLGKTTLSFFNILPLFFFLPFSIVLLAQGYNPFQVICWFFSMVFFTISLNYLNFLLNKNNKVFYAIVAVLGALILLEFYHIYPIAEYAGLFFNEIYNKWYAVSIPLLLMILLYRRNYKFIREGFYLDDAIRKESKEVSSTDLGFLNRFGSIAPFLKNDVKLIIRNARPKQVLMMSFLFLFYGLIFYTQDMYRDMPAFLAFASIFVTGGFLLSFGQLVPSWDSEYYKMLMSQNIPYRKYLESKWYLMVVAVVASFILSTPYLYFGYKIYSMIAAGALFNIGLNSFITLYGGVLNRVPVELNVKAKAFSNTQGFNPTQLLIALPKMAGPMLIFYLPYKFINFEAGILALALSGILGLVFKNFFLNQIEKVYQKGKYKTIAAFDEKK
ncbi:hypothetical protein LX95_00570 [Mesonia algae]|uniref:ABC-2 type transport system permease protein n=1 Tax=Mesonia algae TaxID=213248 RepID=A0A2W7IBF2_9FLAO|nr:DUF5687 family protein [Mesonia algae]PZW44236.1 hypothetical protein LX95_00570 [Mesonia algae]